MVPDQRRRRKGLYNSRSGLCFIQGNTGAEGKHSGTGYFRVRKDWKDAASQIGAFKDRENAVELAKQNAGYYVFDNAGNRIYRIPAAPVAAEYKVSVTDPDLRIRKGPGTTFDYWKKDGKPVYTGKGAFTIVEEAEGPGASKWGLLKASRRRP